MTSETSSSPASPQIESCCYRKLVLCCFLHFWYSCVERRHTATSILSRPTNSILLMTFFSILTSWDSFFDRSGPKAPAAFLRNAWPRRAISISIGLLNKVAILIACPRKVIRRGIAKRTAKLFVNSNQLDSPKLLRPNKRPDFVLDGGGGGFSICEAVGARDWRIE